jgi:hypothetical protein
MMEEKFLKLFAQIGLISLIIWVVAGALGKKDQVTITTKTGQPDAHDKLWAKGDVWQKGCVDAPYGQLSFSPGLVMGRP